jgi:hypothetical protein
MESSSALELNTELQQKQQQQQQLEVAITTYMLLNLQFVIG